MLSFLSPDPVDVPLKIAVIEQFSQRELLKSGNCAGIKTKLFKKQLKSIHWNNIERVTYGSVKRNPTYTIVSKDGCEINLDTRKAIRQLFIFYSNNYNFVFNDRK